MKITTVEQKIDAQKYYKKGINLSNKKTLKKYSRNLLNFKYDRYKEKSVFVNELEKVYKELGI